MTMDYCSRTFGSAPCTATASVKCHNTYPTCRDKANFDRTTKEYKFTSADAPLPFKTGERPYIKSVKYMPTEIKDSLTINARIIIELFDEPDTDVGIDPYLSDRSSIQGTFWKKFLARNTNYKGRKVQLYDGFLDLSSGDVIDIRISEAGDIRITEAGDIRITEERKYNIEEYFEEKFVGEIDNIKIKKDIVKIEVVDLLKSIAKIEIPPKLNIRLASDITDSQTQITLEGDDISSLDSPMGYVRIDDEIIYYGAINTTTKIISSCTRGHFSTTADIHSKKNKVQKTRYFAPASGFDHMKTILLTDCSIAAGYVNSTEFDTQRDDNAGDVEIDFSAIVSEPVKAEELYFELIDLLNCKSWVAEDLKITIRRNLPNRPGRSYTTLTDEANIIFGSPKVDLNQKSRISRASLYWDRTAVGDNNEPADFIRLDVAVDADAEGINEYNEIAEKEILCRWLRSGYDTEENMATFTKNHPSRLVGQFRDPMPLIDLKLELKDSEIKTGDYLKISTDELQDKNGDDLSLAPFQAVRREKKNNQILLKCLQITPKKYTIIASSGYSSKTYDSATAAEREYGAISDINNLMINGDDGYRIW